MENNDLEYEIWVNAEGEMTVVANTRDYEGEKRLNTMKKVAARASRLGNQPVHFIKYSNNGGLMQYFGGEEALMRK